MSINLPVYPSSTLERRRMWPERLITLWVSTHSRAGIRTQHTGSFTSPQALGKAKPCSGTVLIKKLDLCLKIEAIKLCSEVDSSKPIRSASEFLYHRDRTFKIVSKRSRMNCVSKIVFFHLWVYALCWLLHLQLSFFSCFLIHIGIVLHR